MQRRAKIVATLGPASQSVETITELMHAGVNVFRLNFSHGTQADHAMVYQRVRQLSWDNGRPVAIFQDLQGPKIRTGELAQGVVNLVQGQQLTLTTTPLLGDETRVSVDFPGLTKSVQPGGRILLDDGNLELEVQSVQDDQVFTRVILGGVLKPHKGVNLPGARLDIPGFTAKDEINLKFGLELGVDAVAVSFVRTPEDIFQVRKAIERLAPETSIPIIAKLERPEALENLEAIIQAADGVMVARGDLGVEMQPEAVPIAQKRIIETANRYAKLVITATQMLDSMIQNPRPTRAEASDVANAIFDGTDAVMLSGETAAGKYPVKAVQMMDAIIRQAEQHLQEWSRWPGTAELLSVHDDAFYMTRAVREMAQDRDVAAIVAFTRSGRTADLLSKHRPMIPILAFTPEQATYNRLNMHWGVFPYLVNYVETLPDMLQAVDQIMISSGLVQPGQQVLVTCGYPMMCNCPTNLAMLHRV